MSNYKAGFIIAASGAIMIAIISLAIYFHFNEEKPEAAQTQGTVVEIVESPAGFDIYVKDSLVFEFTQQNCDSNSLETLEMLFNAEKELRSQRKEIHN